MTVKKKTKSKPMTLRQRLRADAEKKLGELEVAAKDAVYAVLNARKTRMLAGDLMHLISVRQNKTLRESLITELSNEKEAELEELYNKQQGLDLGDENGD